jgi:hypothetical protein
MISDGLLHIGCRCAAEGTYVISEAIVAASHRGSLQQPLCKGSTKAAAEVWGANIVSLAKGEDEAPHLGVPTKNNSREKDHGD